LIRNTKSIIKLDVKSKLFYCYKKTKKKYFKFYKSLNFEPVMINSFLKRYGLLIVFFIVFSIVAISSFNYVQNSQKNLPIYSPSMVSDELVEEDLRYVKKYHRINDFSLLNQNGNNITQDNYKNKIYVADFFFTTCPDICPIMTGNMVYLQENLKDTNVMLASFSVTPEVDNVDVLKKYSIEKGVDDSKWNLMTGEKKQIYDLARKSYLVAKAIPDGNNHAMIHTENFVLVDKEKRIRGYYDGTNIEDMDKLLDDIQILIKSYKNS
tara:strand:+ start:1358 stop:2155 length:798 start_codon:yes stop_codon:yes gene_type:complete